MASLSTGPKHGYAIAKDVEKITDGAVSFSAATMYDNIAGLLEQGYIEREGEKQIEFGERRKTYRITARGVKVLSEHRRIVAKVDSSIPEPAPGFCAATE